MLSVNDKIHKVGANDKIHMLSVNDKIYMLSENDTIQKKGALSSPKHNQKWALTPGISGLQRTSCNQNPSKVQIISMSHCNVRHKLTYLQEENNP